MAEWLSFSLDPEQETAPGGIKGYAEAGEKIRHPYEGKNDLQQDTIVQVIPGSRHHTRTTREGKGLSASSDLHQSSWRIK